MNQQMLNIELYNEFEKDIVNEKRIVDLLKKGANPLGNMSSNSCYEEPYEEIIYENKNLYTITKILLENGMVINNNNYYNDDKINPLWALALRPDTVGIKTLKLLLDYKTDVNSIEILVDHIYLDYVFLENKDELARKSENNNEIEIETKVRTYYSFAMKMLMLCASYNYVLDNSEYIKDIIDYDKNNSNNIIKFKNFNNIYVRETKRELRFYTKKDNKLIWKIIY